MCKTVQTYNQVVAIPEITLMEGSSVTGVENLVRFQISMEFGVSC